MAITWRTIGFPDHLMRVKAGSMRLFNIGVNSGSQLSNFVRATGLVAQRWVGQFDLATMTREQWQEWESFIARLSGQVILFEVRSPVRPLPLGEHAGFAPGNSAYPITGVTITGTNILTGATTGLVLQAAPRNAEAILVDFGDAMAGEQVLDHGDTFGLGGNLYLVTGPVTADEDGHARVAFRWKLHKPARVGDIVNFRNPTCRVMLQNPNEGMVNYNAALHGEASLGFMEVPHVQ